jgi:hypothetical protein
MRVGKCPKNQRDQMVERLQSSDGAQSRLFVPAVKPAGAGLNLSPGNHVCEADRFTLPVA